MMQTTSLALLSRAIKDPYFLLTVWVDAGSSEQWRWDGISGSELLAAVPSDDHFFFLSVPFSPSEIKSTIGCRQDGIH